MRRILERRREGSELRDIVEDRDRREREGIHGNKMDDIG